MTKSDKCCASDSVSSSKCESSESSSSEVCYKVKCEKKCGEKCCDIPDCKCLRPEEIVCKFRNAIVGIHSEFIFLSGTAGVTGLGATAGTPLSDNRIDLILNGNGFFFNESHQILAPASRVLAPATISQHYVRYPLADKDQAITDSYKNEYIRASRILVTVFDVNNKGKSYVYEANLIGVDGAGDIAVLEIKYNNCDDCCKENDRCHPKIEKCHPHISHGCSDKVLAGSRAYLIGDFVTSQVNSRAFNAATAVTEGVVADAKYIDYLGYALQELVLVNAPAYSYSAGLPILDCQGRYIGMQTTDVVGVDNDAVGFVSGPSERFMRRSVKAIQKAQKDDDGKHKNYSCKCQECNIERVCDAAGAYYVVKKAYLGLAYEVFTGPDFDITTDFTSGGAHSGQPRIRLSEDGQFLPLPRNPQIAGLRVLGIAGANPNDASAVANGYYYVPGGTASVAPLITLPAADDLLSNLLPGDLLVSLTIGRKGKAIKLGDLEHQVAPLAILESLCPDSLVNICFRRGGNALNGSDNDDAGNYEEYKSVQVCTGEMPALIDYPWYAVGDFFGLAEELGATLHKYPDLGGDAPAFHPSV